MYRIDIIDIKIIEILSITTEFVIVIVTDRKKYTIEKNTQLKKITIMITTFLSNPENHEKDTKN